MSDDLVSRLRDGRVGSAVDIACQLDDLCQEAATALTEARAEIERLRATPLAIENARLQKWIDLHRGDVMSLSGEVEQFRAERDAAESELSTLRVRVREVVGPFGKIDPFETAFSKHGKIFRLDYNASLLDQLTFEHFRAARQLMEEVK